MKYTRSILAPALCAVLCCWTSAVQAQPPAQAQAQSTPLTRQAIESAEGMDLFVSRLEAPPGYKAESHSHAGETFVYVLSGRILNQINDEEPQVFEAGGFFFEPANAQHARFENLSTEESAVVLIYGIRPTPPN